MPPARLPPTPASSTDLRGKDKLAPLAPALTLPPAAYTERSDRTASSTPSNNGSDSSYNPVSPASPAHVQRKLSLVSQQRPIKAADNFALPPPPTRSRKIIQMKPKDATLEQTSEDVSAEAAAAVKGAGGRRKGSAAGSTAAGRKIARKTAHSLIERRRRSKMNEEFGVLKDMIPACRGQEMHKLAILQASIDYLRYLERCITDLKTVNGPSSAHLIDPISQQGIATSGSHHDVMEDEGSDSDEAMTDDDHDAVTPNNLSQSQSRPSLPSVSSLPSMSRTTTQNASPTILPADHHLQNRHYSISSTSQASFSPYIHSTQTSPFFGPSYNAQDPAAFALTSPALKPQDGGRAAALGHAGPHQHRERREQELDQEAMAALLMLNSDRRTWKGQGGRGMSVQDLLTN